MKLLIDMNLTPRWVVRLSDGGFQAVHWSDIGLVAAPDHEIMAYAAEHEYIVFTHDLDFGTILGNARRKAECYSDPRCRYSPRSRW